MIPRLLTEQARRSATCSYSLTTIAIPPFRTVCADRSFRAAPVRIAIGFMSNHRPPW